MAKVLKTRVTEKGVISELVSPGGESFDVKVDGVVNVTATESDGVVPASDVVVVGADTTVVLPLITSKILGKEIVVLNTGSLVCTLSASNPTVTTSGSFTSSVNPYQKAVCLAVPGAGTLFWSVKIS